MTPFAGSLLLSAATVAHDPGDDPPRVTYPTVARQASTLRKFVPQGRVQTVRVRKKSLLDRTQVGDGLMFDPDEH